MIRKREEKEQFNLLFPIKIHRVKNCISPWFPLLYTLPFPTTSTVMPVISTITSFSLLHSHFFVSFSSLPDPFSPKNLCPSIAASLLHCSIHSSAHYRHLRRYPYPHAAASLVAVNRHKLRVEGGLLGYQASFSETIRAHPGPLVGSTAMKYGGRNPDDAVLDEANMVLGNEKVVHGNSSCTMGMVFDHTLSPPPKAGTFVHSLSSICFSSFSVI